MPQHTLEHSVHALGLTIVLRATSSGLFMQCAYIFSAQHLQTCCKTQYLYQSKLQEVIHKTFIHFPQTAQPYAQRYRHLCMPQGVVF